VTSTSYTALSGVLSSGQQYYWEVQGYDDTVTPTVQGQYSSAWSFTTQSQSLLPASALSFPSNGATGVSTTPTFIWGAVTGAKKYWLTVATSASTLPTSLSATTCPSCTISTVVTSTSYTALSGVLSSGQQYYWEVQGYDDTVTPTVQGQYSSQWSFTTQASVLSAPVLSGPSNGITGITTTPTFSWSAVTGAKKYWLTVATSASTLPTSLSATTCPSCTISTVVTSTSYTALSGVLSSGHQYYWEVQGYDDTVTPTVQGQYSSQWSFTTHN
jgi:hypothetical protein